MCLPMASFPRKRESRKAPAQTNPPVLDPRFRGGDANAKDTAGPNAAVDVTRL